MWEITLNPRHEDFFKYFSNLTELQEANVRVKQHRRSGIGFFGRGPRMYGIPALVLMGSGH